MKINKNFYYIIILIIILGYFLIKKENYSNDKTICIVWRNKKNENQRGFGDLMRGAIYVYQYCKKNNINFKIDASQDVCGDYLINTNNIYYNDTDNIIVANDNDYDNFDKNVNEAFQNTDIVFVFSSLINNEMDQDDKEFAKKLCEPTDSLRIDILEEIQKLPKDYGIQHMRFSDDIFLNNDTYNIERFEQILNKIRSTYKPTDVLITNSNNFKKYANEKINIQCIEYGEKSKLTHIGYNTNSEDVKYSFIDLIIICNSKYINAYNENGGVTGFSYLPSQIYDIPYTY